MSTYPKHLYANINEPPLGDSAGVISQLLGENQALDAAICQLRGMMLGTMAQIEQLENRIKNLEGRMGQ